MGRMGVIFQFSIFVTFLNTHTPLQNISNEFHRAQGGPLIYLFPPFYFKKKKKLKRGERIMSLKQVTDYCGRFDNG